MRNLFVLFIAVLLGVAANAQEKPSFEGLKDINGTKLYFKIIGKGEPIIVIHGGPNMSHDYLLPHLEPLAKKYQLILFDQRAAGRSVLPDSNEMSYTRMVDDIEGVRKALGLDSVYVFAHSWGTKLAINYALQYPDHIKKMVLSNPVVFSHEFDSLQQATFAKKFTDEDKAYQKSLVRSEAFENGDPKVIKQLMLLNYRMSFYDTANLARLNIILPEDFMKQSMLTMRGLMTDQHMFDKNYYPLINDIKQPVLIVRGAADNLVLQADEKLQMSLGDAQLVTLFRSGHFPFVEENDKFIKAVTEFLAKPIEKKTEE